VGACCREFLDDIVEDAFTVFGRKIVKTSLEFLRIDKRRIQLNFREFGNHL